MNDIRFFYSTKDSLLTLKESLTEKKDFDNKKSSLQIDFCLDVPLLDLQNQAILYYKKMYTLFNQRRRLKDIEMYDILDSVFYLVATKYELNNFKYNYKLDNFLKITPLKKSSLFYYSRMYIELIQGKLLGFDDDRLINKNREKLDDFYVEFISVLNKNTSYLMHSIENDLKSVNRMRNLYQNHPQEKTVGYQNFSSLLSLFGKILVWNFFGNKLEISTLDNIFMNEFNKKADFFYF